MRQKSRHARRGTSLTEVLMAILCMGIGVVAVASLFPIALLRSVQATQLTSATILRFNAETMIDLHNEIPPRGNLNLILNPDGNSDFTEHFNKNYLVDPLGAMIVRGDNGRPLATTDRVGLLNRYDALPIFLPSPAYDPAMVEGEAEDIVTLPDSWVTFEGFDDFPSANTSTSLTLSANTTTGLSDLETMVNAGTEVRAVLFSTSGKTSEVRLLTTSSFPGGNVLTWAPPLPADNNYFPDKVERVQFQYKERRYTWLLTVRNDALPATVDPAVAKARVDVVVFFRRSPSVEEETPYIITGNSRNYTVSKIPAADWSKSYPASVPYPDPYPDPFLKKGGFMLDTRTGTWHRLQKINDFTKGITLERNTRTLDGDHVVFMRGVVDVYPLGSKP